MAENCFSDFMYSQTPQRKRGKLLMNDSVNCKDGFCHLPENKVLENKVLIGESVGKNRILKVVFFRQYKVCTFTNRRILKKYPFILMTIFYYFLNIFLHLFINFFFSIFFI